MVRPIHTEDDLTAALARIREIEDAEPGSPEDDELDILATLVVEYEKKHDPVGPPDPVEAVRFAMDQQNLRVKDLASCFGSSARASEFLHGKRNLTVSAIYNLHREFGIPLEVLVSPPKNNGAGTIRLMAPPRVSQEPSYSPKSRCSAGIGCGVE